MRMTLWSRPIARHQGSETHPPCCGPSGRRGWLYTCAGAPLLRPPEGAGCLAEVHTTRTSAREPCLHRLLPLRCGAGIAGRSGRGTRPGLGSSERTIDRVNRGACRPVSGRGLRLSGVQHATVGALRLSPRTQLARRCGCMIPAIPALTVIQPQDNI